MTVTLESLAEEVSQKTRQVQELLSQQPHVQAPSFEVPGSAAWTPADSTFGSLKLRQARYDLARAARSLFLLAQGPEDHVLQLAWAGADTANLAAILRTGLVEAVPTEGTISAANLAANVGLPLDITTRVVRQAITNGIFQEVQSSVFAHNATSAALANNAGLRDIASLSSAGMSQIQQRTADWLELVQKKAKGDDIEIPASVFELVYPGVGDVFSFAKKNPRFAGGYHKYMTARANTWRWKIEHMLKAPLWKTIGTKTVVDVGGSHGHTSLALAQECPNARFIIQDIDPTALDGGRALVSKQDQAIASRIEFAQYDFFTPNKIQGDVYIFRHILHDWPDKKVIEILRNQVPALKDGALVLVSEGVVPEKKAQLANTLDEKQIW